MSASPLDEVREVARRLRDAIGEHDDVSRRLAATEADYKRTRLTALTLSLAEHGKARTVQHHEAEADLAASEIEAGLLMLKAMERSLREEMHSLRSVLSAYQTTARVEMESL